MIDSVVTEASAEPPLDAAEQLATGGERAMLEAFLGLYRETAARKLRGVSEDNARRRLVPSMTTLGGIVKHLRWVEHSWFQRVLAGRPAEELPTPPWTDEDPDADFRMGPGETVEGLIAAYEEQCALSRQAATDRELDDSMPHPRLGGVSLRWIYVHMIEETARHAGHADILREQIDGTTEP